MDRKKGDELVVGMIIGTTAAVVFIVIFAIVFSTINQKSELTETIKVFQLLADLLLKFWFYALLILIIALVYLGRSFAFREYCKTNRY